MPNRRDVLLSLGSTGIALTLAEHALATVREDRTLEDFVGADIIQKIADSDAALQVSGRLKLSPVARAYLTKFALTHSISMPVRLPTKADLHIASDLLFQAECFRGKHGTLALLNDTTFLMSKNLPPI